MTSDEMRSLSSQVDVASEYKYIKRKRCSIRWLESFETFHFIKSRGYDRGDKMERMMMLGPCNTFFSSYPITCEHIYEEVIDGCRSDHRPQNLRSISLAKRQREIIDQRTALAFT